MARFLDVFADVTKEGRKIPKEDYLPSGPYPIIDQGQNDIAGYWDDEAGLYSEVPSIIFGDHTRVIKYVDTPCFLGADGVKLLKPVLPNTNCKYLYYALCSVKIPNTGYNRHFKWLKEVDIPIPAPETQAQIVAVLDKICDLISLRKQQLDKLDELVKARFVEMFGDIILNPKGWKVEPLGKHIEVLTGFPFDSDGYSTDGVKICGGLIIMPGRVNWADCKYWPDSGMYENYLLADSDIVMALDRPWIAEGFKISMVFQKDLPALLIQRTARIRAHDMNQEFVYALLQNSAFEIHCNVTGSLVPHISHKDIVSFPVIVPPIALQNSYSIFSSEITKQKLTIQQSLDKLEMLKKALMQEYFGGEISHG